MRLVLLGVPGVGKGTQGRRLAGRLGIPQIATGEILREAVKNRTALGVTAQERMNQGLLVPDEVVIGIVEERLAQPDAARGFILDGFPRTVAQAQALDAMLVRAGRPLDLVLNMTAPTEAVVARLAERLECPVCHRTYHPSGAPPKDGVHCDDHPEAVLVHRADDDLDRIRKRIEVFEQETAPLADYYRRDGRLTDIEGLGGLDEVHARLTKAIEGRTGASGTRT